MVFEEIEKKMNNAVWIIIVIMVGLAGLFIGAAIQSSFKEEVALYRIDDQVCVSIEFKNLDVICHMEAGHSITYQRMLYPVTVYIIGGQ